MDDYLAADASRTKRLILLTLARHGSARIRLEDLAYRVPCAMSTLHQALKEMRADGWVSWKRGKGGRSSRGTNAYQLHPANIPRLEARPN
jgi:DNA-binding IclR family transcriptional regulator